MYFVREIEFKILIRNLTIEKKIKKFFDIYNISKSVEDKYLINNYSEFLDENLA